MPEDVLVSAKHLQLLRELASRSLTFTRRGYLIGVPAGFDRDDVESALTQPELNLDTPDDPLLYWPEAERLNSEQAGYDKSAWSRMREAYKGSAADRKRLSEWLEIVYPHSRAAIVAAEADGIPLQPETASKIRAALDAGQPSVRITFGNGQCLDVRLGADGRPFGVIARTL